MRFSRRAFASMAGAGSLLLPKAIHAKQASPVATSAGSDFSHASDRFASFAPAHPQDQLQEDLNTVWIDAERQVASHLGSWDVPAETRRPSFFDTRYGNTPPLFEWGLALDDVFGFNMLGIRRISTAGVAPYVVHIVELDQPAAPLTSLWEEAGYEQKEGQSGGYWTLGEEFGFELSHPVQGITQAYLNNISLLEENIVACAPTLQLLESARAGHQDNENQTDEAYANIITGLPEDAVGAWIVTGQLDFRVIEDESDPRAQSFIDSMAESDDAVGPMPVLRTLCTGVTAGASLVDDLHEQDSAGYLIVESEEPGTAQQVADVFNWRVENYSSFQLDKPYYEMIGELNTDVVSDNVVRFECFGQAAQRGMLSEMVRMLDTLPLRYVIRN